MTPRQLKLAYFLLEGTNSFATVYYSYYLYFFMQKVHGFDNRANLLLAALNGLVYMFAAWWAGRLAQRRGNFPALKLGFGLMLIALVAGSRISSAAGQVVVMSAVFAGAAFTWPALEALVSEAESATRLPRIVGIYNVVWAGTGALAYFLGGALLERFGLRSLFYVPAILMVGQFAFAFWLEARAKTAPIHSGAPLPEVPAALPELNPRPIAKARTFLRLAWWANPFAYIAMNTILAVIPGVATRLKLSTMYAGFFCSLWCFARVAAFVGLWRWDGWHYRFGWLLAAYVLLIGSFAAVLLAPSLHILLLAQIAFGLAIGLLYYSSLYYSMNLSDNKSEHGGIHEAAIGLGNCIGPGVGAVSLTFWPQSAAISVVAVSALLLIGLTGLVIVARKG